MKKVISLVLALTLCMGLATPAFAAETEYQQLSFWLDGENLLGFDQAKMEETTIRVLLYDDAVEQTAIILYVKPGSTMRVIDANENPVAGSYELYLDNSLYTMDGDVYLKTFFTETEYTNQEQIFNMWLTPYLVTDNTPVDGMFAKLQENNAATRKDLDFGVGSVAALCFWNTTADGGDVAILAVLDDGTFPKGNTQPTAPVTPPAEEPAVPTTPAEPVQPATPATPTVEIPADAITYTVQKYDTMGQIALTYYGSLACHKALTNANAEAFKATKGALKPGMTLVLPATLGKTVRIAAPTAGAGETLYTVQAGDTLGAIAAKTYGDVKAYKAIFERNSDRLKDANTIYVGQVIVLPAK